MTHRTSLSRPPQAPYTCLLLRENVGTYQLALELAFQRQYCEVDTAPAAEGVVLAPCFAPVFPTLVMSKNSRAFASIPRLRLPNAAPPTTSTSKR